MAFEGVISKEKYAASSRKLGGEFHQPPALVENPYHQRENVFRKMYGDQYGEFASEYWGLKGYRMSVSVDCGLS